MFFNSSVSFASNIIILCAVDDEKPSGRLISDVPEITDEFNSNQYTEMRHAARVVFITVINLLASQNINQN